MPPPAQARNGVDVEATLGRLAAALKLKRDALEADPRGARLAAMVRGMAKDGRERDDPIRAVFGRLGDKWSMLLLLLLDTGPLGHAALARLAGVMGADEKISQRMLTLRLRTLERDGLVRRTTTFSVPPRVDYALTPLGQGLVGQALSLMDWIRGHDAEVRAARARFDAENPEPR